MTKDNPFNAFIKPDIKTAFIKSLDAEIKFRLLTAKEDDQFNLRMMKGTTPENRTPNMEEASKIKYEKIALCLIEPKVTIKELESLQGASDVIAEILTVLSKHDAIDDEGNSES